MCITTTCQPLVGATLRSTCHTQLNSWCAEERDYTTIQTTCKHVSNTKTATGFNTQSFASQGTMLCPLLWIQETSMSLEDHIHQQPVMSYTWAMTTGPKVQNLPGMLSSSKPALPTSTLPTS